MVNKTDKLNQWILNNVSKKVIFQTIAIFIFLYLFMQVLPPVIMNTVLDHYHLSISNNSTIINNTDSAGMHIDIMNGSLIAFLTLIYVYLTNNLVRQTNKEQKIRDIENRLEKFYLPAIDTINEAKKFKEYCPHRVLATYGTNIGTESDPIYLKHNGFDEISKYRYLAENETLEKFESILLMKNEFPKNKQLMIDEIKNLKEMLESDRGDYMNELKKIKKE